MTFRTTFRETRKSRQIALIVIFREKYARRILAIVSTISISNSASQTTRRPVWTLIPGVPIGCRSPRKRGPYSMPNDKRELGLGSYETAWTWLHKLRRAMVRPGRGLLSGTIEVDE